MRDQDLTDAFARLDATVWRPSFDALTGHQARRRRRRQRWATVAVAAILVMPVPAALVLWSRRSDAIDFERFAELTGLDPSSVTWRAPTDFLLDTPGRALLSDLPRLDVAVPAFAPDSTPAKRQRSDS